MEPPEVIPASMTRMLLLWVIVVTFSTIMARAKPCSGQQSGRIDYNRDIRPILSDKCFFCHGPDAAQRQAELRLDIRQQAIDSGAIDSADPPNSPLIERILSEDDGERMPPPESHKSLTPEEKDRLVEWVRAGAVYEEHWSYQPVKRPDSSANNKNPVDTLVDEELEQAGVQPLPGADRRTLIRRLAFDLMGMPPTTGEVEQFLHDENPDAWQKVVDEFLSRPQYGERMATPWLDVVRYADTVGYHGDQNHNVWAYRDWVIDALNENMPFDRFTIEQLAGDLLPNPSPAQLVPTCFNRLNMVTREGGAQPEEYVARYMADRVRTVSTAWLGLTMGCAECHDHKYDPSTSRDFYSLGAFFADIQQWGVYHDYPYTPNPDLRGFSNDHPFPPEMEIESEFLVRRREELKREQIALATSLPADKPEHSRWVDQARDWLATYPDGWQVLEPVPTGQDEKNFAIEETKTIRFNADAESSVSFSFEGPIAAARIELSPVTADDGSAASIRRDRSQSEIRLDPEFAVLRAGVDKPERIPIAVADANQKSPIYANGFELIGITRGWQTANAAQNHAAIFVFRSPIALKQGDRLTISLRDSKKVAAIRVSVSPLAPLNAESLHDSLIPQTDSDWALAGIRSTGQPGDVYKKLAELDREILDCRHGKTPVLITCAVEPAQTRVLPRGNWQDKSGAIAEPAVPHFLPQLSLPEGRRLTRLDLAQWLVNGDHPLVARVAMNRLWMQFFGEGLVSTPDDFGSQGSNPSHPRLLDWLASEFVASGWDMKHMCRVILTSEAYQRVSATGETRPAADPDNRLLWRQRPRRLTAEMVRDNALAISGLLDLERGGPPIKPLQPEGYYAHLQFPDRPYAESGDRDRFRRSVYIHWQRTFLLPMLLGFDAPTREDCIAMRNEANNPQQALTLLNDPAMVELAGAFAERLLKDGADATAEDRVGAAIQLAVQRPPTAEETASLTGLVAKLTDHYRQNPELALRLSMARRYSWQDTSLDPVAVAVWTNVARVILNLHETITRY
jgi:Protein of unknown function (DUF1553)/Protein of unknown function (DUF1549)/Planctomycete cytochrome C